MSKVRETARYMALWFAIGFILGSLLDCTIHRTFTVDMVVSSLWGAGVCIIMLLTEKLIFDQLEKRHMREEEINKVIKMIDVEISGYKKQFPSMMAKTDEAGTMTLAGIYIDRIIYLETLKASYRILGKSNIKPFKSIEDIDINKIQDRGAKVMAKNTLADTPDE